MEIVGGKNGGGVVTSLCRKCGWPDLVVGWASETETLAVMFGQILSQAGLSE